MRGNILIIDDSSIERKIINQAIKNRLDDINIFEVDNGLDISKKLLENNIHACVLDVMMPQKNGFQVLQEIKEDCNLMDIPVIVCTGISDKAAVEKALSLGAFDYFAKPLTEEAIKISLPLKIKNAIDLMKRKEEIIYLSYHDQLTGLYNRRFFEEELARINTKSNLPITLIMGDLNGLKLINDSFGHAMGDEVIKRVGKMMKLGSREDDIVARLAGDEFVIISPKTDGKEACKIINNIMSLLAKEKVGSVEVSMSLGYGCKYNEEEKIEDVFKKAEDTMYGKKVFESQSMRGRTIKTVINTLREKSKIESEHSFRVSALCKRVGEALDLPINEINKLVSAGELHDIGKIIVDERTINKPGKLTADEWEEVKRHSEIGYRMISTVDDMTEIANYILYHHERWDGSGYPKGLKGEEIPFISRIITIADAYDAMVSERCYKDILSKEAAIEELKNNAGSQFDPDLVKIFINKVLK
ncbi:HD domain-containing phosphohydrolase [Clostridium saccharoperbutylacetonicum]|uniref:HD domain-containing phosphohydrolase n=1 Tax=Clostridium saccharoperbutylacetonicum TaxID=36745 RepID=UPI000983EC5F|nr:HD domain-containing phosphohydrolase [Clostridium saccharoperbutylacetonicum]AQR94932.1 cyclic di-GMP phosphodiesterase response regulator RpfG [Clostridium saccharoperbutylacetonicum]NSB30775.1 diguanylate cyclase (GGDEF)-like protein [Clostridium saccharoperbutylacetonicum]